MAPVTRLGRPRDGFEPLLRELADALGPLRDTGAWLTGAAAWLELVVTWNGRIDLTAARSAEELVDLAVADALLLARHADDGSSWLDVGSGFGGPGLGLALARPDLAVTLVEPRHKRASFLRTAIGAARAERATVRRARVEELAPAPWDTAVARATFAPARWLELGSPLARSVWVLLADGAAPAENPALERDRDVMYRWPLTGVQRRAVRYSRSSAGKETSGAA